MALVAERPLIARKHSSRPVVVGALCLYRRTAHLSRIRTVVHNESGVIIPPQGMAPSGGMSPVAGEARYLISCGRTAQDGIVVFRMTVKSPKSSLRFLVRNE